MSEPTELMKAEETELELFALTPSDIKTAQSHLSAWCLKKMGRLKTELRGIQANLNVAIKSKWKSSSWKRLAGTTAKRIDYYAKIHKALEAGYLLIPNFPIDMFAIRTSREKPVEKESEYEHNTRTQKAQVLSVGEGRYVNPQPWRQSRMVPETDKKTGQLVEKEHWFACDFDEVAFPILAVKPQVLEATHKAMALKLFDEVGLVGAKRDPIVVGRILDPRPVGYGERRHVTFFIAWWLNTEEI